jgi:hypothetical protein
MLQLRIVSRKIGLFLLVVGGVSSLIPFAALAASSSEVFATVWQPRQVTQRPFPLRIGQGTTAPNAPNAPSFDTTVVPGERLGPITAQTTYQDLVKLFGAQRLSETRPPDADDTQREFGTRIDLGPDWALTLVWQDQTKTKPYQAMDMGPGWQLPGGLRTGMAISDLQQKLGPFQMVGLGGPYGGIVPLTRTTLEPYFGKLIIQMAPAPGTVQQFPKQYQAVSGERLIPVSDPNWQPLGMRVKHLIFLFPRRA